MVYWSSGWYTTFSFWFLKDKSGGLMRVRLLVMAVIFLTVSMSFVTSVFADEPYYREDCSRAQAQNFDCAYLPPDTLTSSGCFKPVKQWGKLGIRFGNALGIPWAFNETPYEKGKIFSTTGPHDEFKARLVSSLLLPRGSQSLRVFLSTQGRLIGSGYVELVGTYGSALAVLDHTNRLSSDFSYQRFVNLNGSRQYKLTVVYGGSEKLVSRRYDDGRIWERSPKGGKRLAVIYRYFKSGSSCWSDSGYLR